MWILIGGKHVACTGDTDEFLDATLLRLTSLEVEVEIEVEVTV